MPEDDEAGLEDYPLVSFSWTECALFQVIHFAWTARSRVLSIMPNRPVIDSVGILEGNGQPVGMPLATFYSFSESQKHRAKNLFVKNGTANFGRNIPTEITPKLVDNLQG